MKKSLDIFIWAVLLFLITPSGMALASWNAVPGDYTYSWKLSLEKVLLIFLSPSNKLQSTTQVKIAERRYSEFEQVLDSEYAIESLGSLNKQLETTSSDIQKINQTDSRDEVTDQYIISLKKMSVALGEQKAKAQAGEVAIVTQKASSVSKDQTQFSLSKPSVKPTVKPTIASPTNVPTSISSPAPTLTSTPTPVPTSLPTANLSVEETNTAEVISEISKTEDNINQVIEDLEQGKKSNQDKSKDDSKDDSKNDKNDDKKDDKDKSR